LFAARRVLLSNKVSSGLTNDLYQSFNNTPKATFAGKSIFCDICSISEAELIAWIAAGIHHSKTEGQEMGTSRVKLGMEHPMYTIIRTKQLFLDAQSQKSCMPWRTATCSGSRRLLLN